MIKKIKVRLIKFLLRSLKSELKASYETLKVDDANNIYAMWGEYSHLLRKIMKIHICTCIETMANNQREATLIRETLNDLESFIELYYNTIVNEIERKKP